MPDSNRGSRSRREAAISFRTNLERSELLASTLHLYSVTPAVLPYLLSLREPHEIVLISSSLFAHSTFLSVDQCQRPRPAVSAWLLARIFGFRDSAAENAIEARFLAVPDPKLAEEHLRTLTQAPHMAGTPEDKATADYVAQKFRAAGLDTEIVEYKVWMNYPAEISVDITAPAGVEMHGPTREHVDGDPYDDDPRVVMPFNGMSPSGDAEAEVVYANYGTPEDFEKLEKLKDRCARQDRAGALRPELPRGEGIHRAGTWRGRSDHLFRSVRRWLAARR